MVVGIPFDMATTTYAEDVVSGRQTAGPFVRLACQRHLDDLRDGPERGLSFDEDAANHAIQFSSFLHHSKGEWAGQSFVLAPWQQFIVGNLFGWKRADGTRRFRTAYNEVPRKNGKSTLSAMIALYLAFIDGEPGAEVYCAATKREQAKIVWDEARRMVEATPALKKRIRVMVARPNLSSEATASKLEPLGADSDSSDGLNIHGAIVDEVHAHKTRAMIDVIETATGARRQPLTFYVTTAGYNRNSICWELRDYATKILETIVNDDTTFAYIATIDIGDDWTAPSVWAKANPNYGISVKVDDLERKCAKAIETPGQQNAFKRLHLNIWTEQAERWLDIARWDACDAPIIDDRLRGQVCYAGLDLSGTRDLTAFVAVFPDPSRESFDVLCRFWIPEDTIEEAERRDRVPYRQWVDAGLVSATEGNVTDFDAVRDEIKLFRSRYQVQEIPFDPWNALQLATQLGSDGATVVQMPQNYSMLSEPSKLLEKLILSRNLRHGGNPVLRWMASNVAILHGPNESIWPVKEKSTGRVDGIVALIMGLKRATISEAPKRSVYERRGLTVIG